jgi:hypothetical protein
MGDWDSPSNVAMTCYVGVCSSLYWSMLMVEKRTQRGLDRVWSRREFLFILVLLVKE